MDWALGTWHWFASHPRTSFALAALILTHLTTACVTIYLHRSQTHRSVELHPLVAHPMRFWLWFTTAMKTIEWVAVHRCHHANVETEDDPHSPVFFGIWRVLFLGAPLYHKAASDEALLAQYGHGTPRDFLERHVYARAHSFLGVLVLLGAELWLLGWPGLLLWLIQMAWIPFFAAGVINGIGHYRGYRNFETRDNSRNVFFPLLAFLTCGENWHNNHHGRQGSAKFSVRWWELDYGYLYIRLLAAVGLARILREKPEPVFA